MSVLEILNTFISKFRNFMTIRNHGPMVPCMDRRRQRDAAARRLAAAARKQLRISIVRNFENYGLGFLREVSLC